MVNEKTYIYIFLVLFFLGGVVDVMNAYCMCIFPPWRPTPPGRGGETGKSACVYDNGEQRLMKKGEIPPRCQPFFKFYTLTPPNLPFSLSPPPPPGRFSSTAKWGIRSWGALFLLWLFIYVFPCKPETGTEMCG